MTLCATQYVHKWHVLMLVVHSFCLVERLVGLLVKAKATAATASSSNLALASDKVYVASRNGTVAVFLPLATTVG